MKQLEATFKSALWETQHQLNDVMTQQQQPSLNIRQSLQSGLQSLHTEIQRVNHSLTERCGREERANGTEHRALHSRKNTEFGVRNKTTGII